MQPVSLTRGQAACKVLGKPVTLLNRKKCKDEIDATPFEVVHAPGDPLEPKGIGTDAIKLAPWNFERYSDTPPLPDDQEESSSTSSLSPTVAASPESTQVQEETRVTEQPTTTNIVSLLDALVVQDGAQDDRYELVDLSESRVRSILERFMPGYQENFSMESVNRGLSQLKSMPNKSRIDNRQWVRMVWLLKDKEMEGAVERLFNRDRYQATVRGDTTFITIGYVRKSNTHEPIDRYIRLMQEMVDDLRLNGCAHRVYCSPKTNASTSILRRDTVDLTGDLREEIKSGLRFTKGDVQDLIAFAQTSQQKIRLIIKDYASLSTKENFLREFFESLPTIQELAIDHGHCVERITRHDLLNNKKAMEKFTFARKGPVRRSPYTPPI